MKDPDKTDSRLAVPAPWTCTFEALVWWRAGGRGRHPQLRPAPPKPLAQSRFGMRVGAVVRYLDTPVGPYSEVLTAAAEPRLPLPVVTVPFIAVDSAASRGSGRDNWALPKIDARFDGNGGRTASGDGWSVAARPHALGPPVVPFLALCELRQQSDGDTVTSTLRVRGVAAPARVDVQLDGDPALAAGMPTGRCWGAVVRHGTLRLGPARRQELPA